MRDKHTVKIRKPHAIGKPRNQHAIGRPMQMLVVPNMQELKLAEREKKDLEYYSIWVNSTTNQPISYVKLQTYHILFKFQVVYSFHKTTTLWLFPFHGQSAPHVRDDSSNLTCGLLDMNTVLLCGPGWNHRVIVSWECSPK